METKYHLKYDFWGEPRHLTYPEEEKEKFEQEVDRVTDDPNILNHTINFYTEEK